MGSQVSAPDFYSSLNALTTDVDTSESGGQRNYTDVLVTRDTETSARLGEDIITQQNKTLFTGYDFKALSNTSNDQTSRSRTAPQVLQAPLDQISLPYQKFFGTDINASKLSSDVLNLDGSSPQSSPRLLSNEPDSFMNLNTLSKSNINLARSSNLEPPGRKK